MSTDSGQGTELKPDATQEQPAAVTTVEIDGQQVSLEEVRAGYLRQADYTKKTQELAEERKKLKPDPEVSEEKSPQDLSKEVDNLVDLLSPRLNERFVSRQETDLEKFLSQNPDLEGKRKLLEDLGKASSKSYWDIASEYDLKPSDALEKAKSRKIVGESKLDEKPGQKLADMTPTEWAEWKKANVGKRQAWNPKLLNA